MRRGDLRTRAPTRSASASRSTGARPRAPASSGAPRSESSRVARAVARDRRERAPRCRRAPRRRPRRARPSAPVRSGGSRTQPTISSTPASRSAITSTETAGGARRATRSSVAPPRAGRVRQPEHDAAARRTCAACRAALSTSGNELRLGERRPEGVHGRARPGRARSRRLRRRTAPSRRRTTCRSSGAAGDGIGSAFGQPGASPAPASTSQARSTSRCTGIAGVDAAPGRVGLSGKIVCTTTGLFCAVAAAADHARGLDLEPGQVVVPVE